MYISIHCFPISRVATRVHTSELGGQLTVQLPEEDRFVICVEEVEVVHTDDFLSALELYFAVVFMLNLSYATKITKFSTFVQHFWLGIRDSNVSKQMRRLYAQLVKGKALYK